MKKYREYINGLSEMNTEYPDIPNMPSDDELSQLYPELEYPGPRRKKWMEDNKAQELKAKNSFDYEKTELIDKQDKQQREITSKILHMINRAYATNNDAFLDDVLDLIEGYPELIVGVKFENGAINTTGLNAGGFNTPSSDSDN